MDIFSDAVNGRFDFGWGQTGSDGVFSFAGVPAEVDYYVRANPTCAGENLSLLNEWYTGTTTLSSIYAEDALTFSVTGDGETDGLFFQLDIGAAISGQVTDGITGLAKIPVQLEGPVPRVRYLYRR